MLIEEPPKLTIRKKRTIQFHTALPKNYEEISKIAKDIHIVATMNKEVIYI
jgi:hypothetical protein